MSIMLALTILLGALATVLFVAGYFRGTGNAIRNHRSSVQPSAAIAEERSYGWSMAFAVFAAAALIGSLGVSPVFFYLPPLLVIATAAVNGLAFFLDRDG
ncbi:MAG: hypothetical protein ABIL01_13150 [Pseudomonadota bacterium]